MNLSCLIVADDVGMTEAIVAELRRNGVPRKYIQHSTRDLEALGLLLRKNMEDDSDCDSLFKVVVTELFDGMNYELKNSVLEQFILHFGIGDHSFVRIWPFKFLSPEVVSFYSGDITKVIIRRRFTDHLTALDVFDEIIKLYTRKK